MIDNLALEMSNKNKQFPTYVKKQEKIEERRKKKKKRKKEKEE